MRKPAASTKLGTVLQPVLMLCFLSLNLVSISNYLSFSLSVPTPYNSLATSQKTLETTQQEQPPSAPSNTLEITRNTQQHPSNNLAFKLSLNHLQITFKNTIETTQQHPINICKKHFENLSDSLATSQLLLGNYLSNRLTMPQQTSTTPQQPSISFNHLSNTLKTTQNTQQ